ncbi:glycosyltransferase family 9 protein, partial [Klebsiella pneumoniae]|nr:glycosyltransferase family 9 protein [Klebsiella pneumoniae]
MADGNAPQVLFVTSNRIGDCVISSGVIREIARQVPGAEITVACGRPPAPF